MTNYYCICDSIYSLNAEQVMFDPDQPMLYYNPTLRTYIHTVKEEIDKRCDAWERNKRYMNPYEFINTPFDNSTPSVCSYRPISRAFFKMTEILHTFNFTFPRTMKSFHLAEGPGGFIEALHYYRKNKGDVYYGMTLIEQSDDNIPKWTKCENFMTRAGNNIVLEKGADGTGNLYHLENIIYLRDTHGHTMDMVTGDGGFDFSLDFNKQEENCLNLIFAEVVAAIVLQKKGGSFILKLYDTFSSASMEIIYLLSCLYEEVAFIKPQPSRPANSEKYIVCMRFKMVPNIDVIVDRLLAIFPLVQQSDHLVHFLNLPLPNLFLDKMKEINSIFGQAQIENIMTTITFISDHHPPSRFEQVCDRPEHVKRAHLNKCVKWCKKHNMPLHSNYA
jgi:23S rRNA U2552 (ribose-2'-O)-methylase RlmE/FtsJ